MSFSVKSINNNAFVSSPSPLSKSLFTTTSSTTICPLYSTNSLNSDKASQNSTHYSLPRTRYVIRSAVASPPPPTSIPSRYSSPQPLPPCTPIVGQEMFDKVLQSHTCNEPIVIMFHARWCRTCKTLRYKLPDIADKYSSITWYDVDFAMLPNKPVCADLGVRNLPTFRIYLGQSDNGDYIDDFTTGPFGSERLIEHLDDFFAEYPHILPNHE